MIIKKQYLKKFQCKITITFSAQKKVADDATLTIRKQYFKNKSQCRITFSAQKGDKFATPVEKNKDDLFAATVNPIACLAIDESAAIS
nr:hypothetical protein [uncultured Desulfobacter sp.]